MSLNLFKFEDFVSEVLLVLEALGELLLKVVAFNFELIDLLILSLVKMLQLL